MLPSVNIYMKHGKVSQIPNFKKDSKAVALIGDSWLYSLLRIID